MGYWHAKKRMERGLPLLWYHKVCYMQNCQSVVVGLENCSFWFHRPRNRTTPGSIGMNVTIECRTTPNRPQVIDSSRREHGLDTDSLSVQQCRHAADLSTSWWEQGCRATATRERHVQSRDQRGLSFSNGAIEIEFYWTIEVMSWKARAAV